MGTDIFNGTSFQLNITQERGEEDGGGGDGDDTDNDESLEGVAAVALLYNADAR
jgi:hypothetical protein